LRLLEGVEATEDATEEAEEEVGFRGAMRPPMGFMPLGNPFEVRAVIRTLLELLLDIRRSCTLVRSLQTSEEEESVEETDPMGDLREEVSSREVEE